ncbi:hypothetical protein [Geminicoccus flavidas]|uniref:hypothetical protein n=1 Tax=Geminicoccus flavidas TaxID=2506407 RepID=UPI00135973FA|nr:hypothetical protein [Geminicoccus flavidas]
MATQITVPYVPVSSRPRLLTLLSAIRRRLGSGLPGSTEIGRLSQFQWQDIGVPPAEQARMQELRLMEASREPNALLWRRMI